MDPKNENRIYDIQSTVTMSEDGGKNFTTLIPYSHIHPDHHAWWINPENPDLIIEGNDGGIGISRDRGRNWVFDEKIPVGQFYHINVDNDLPYHVMGGMQDNGSWLGPAYTWIDDGIKNYYWENIGGGDGFDAMPDPDDANWVYSMSQQGYVGRRNWKTGESWYIRPVVYDTAVKLRFNWNAAIAQDPFDNSTIYYGSQFVHKSTNKGASWSTVSPDLTTNNKEQQKQDENGGLTLDITGAENYNCILAISPSSLEKGLIWVGTDDGNVQLTRDGGKTWVNFRGKIPGLPVGAWIPQIKASRYNAGEAFVVANDYRRGDFNPYVFRTTDYGKTWKGIVDENKVKGYALCVLQDPVEKNLIFLGTEHGLWISFDNGNSYEQWKNGYPSVSTYDLAIQEREADLAIATFGRTIWILDDIRPLRTIAANNGNLPVAAIKVFPAPDAYDAQYKAAPGYEWSTAGLWDAANRKRGAAVSFYLNKPQDEKTSPVNKKDQSKEEEQEAGKKRNDADTVLVKIYNRQDELIRTLQWAADSSFNRMYWGMEEKGSRQPGQPKPKPNSPEPGGYTVLPGTYKLILSYGGSRDSTFVTIKDDPRFENRTSIKIAQRKMLDRLQKSADKLTEVLDRLNEADEVCDKITAQLKDLKGTDIDTLRKATTATKKQINGLKEMITGKRDTRQGLTRSTAVTILSQLQIARQYISSKTVAPGEQETKLTENAENAISTTVEKTNQFFANEWKKYKEQAEGTKIELFKDYRPL